MTGTPRPDTVYTKRRRIAKLAKDCPDMSFTNLAITSTSPGYTRLMSRPARTGPSAWMDRPRTNTRLICGATSRAPRPRKSGTYVAPPVRRVHIPKAGSPSETRPLGIPTFEDKILQRAVLMVLEPVYEADFLDASHGFRPGRGIGALASLWKQAMNLGCCYIVDVDLRKFFDTINSGHLRDLLKRRVRDGVIVRLDRQMAQRGRTGGGNSYESRDRPPQGGVLSPLISNVFLHYVLDQWFEQEVRPR